MNKRTKKLVARAVRYAPGLGATYGPETAQKIGEECEMMMRAGISLTPDTLLERARDPKSIFHSLVTWDDEEAAARWRKHEARQILNHLQIVLIGPQGEETTRKAMFNLAIAEDAEAENVGREYYHLSSVLKDEAKMEQVKQTALREFQSLAVKYIEFGFPELQPIIAAILRK